MLTKTIATIERLSDGKRFGCYFRTGSVRMNKALDSTSYWISKNGDGEELELDYISTEKFKIVERVEK